MNLIILPYELVAAITRGVITAAHNPPMSNVLVRPRRIFPGKVNCVGIQPATRLKQYQKNLFDKIK